MSQRANYFKIGVFVLAATGLAVVGLLIFGAREALEKTILVETYMDDSIQGLDVGSPVKYRGVKIGSVSSIGFISQEYPEASVAYDRYVIVRAKLSLDSNRIFRGEQPGATLQDQVQNGLRARLAPQGITGLAFLEINFLDTKSNPALLIDWEPRHPYIPSARAQFAQITESVERFSRKLEDTDVDGITTSLQDLLTTVDSAVAALKLGEVSEDSRGLIANLRASNERIQTTIEEMKLAEVSDRATTTLDEFSETARTVRGTASRLEENFMTRSEEAGVVMAELTGSIQEARDVIGAVRNVVIDNKLDESIIAFRDATNRLTDATEQLPESLATLNRNLRRIELMLASREHDLGAVLENVRSISESLKNAASVAETHPALLLFGNAPRPVELEE